MIHVTFNLRETDVDKPTSVIMIIRYSGKVMKFPTAVSVLPSRWQNDKHKKNYQRASGPEAFEINQRLDWLETTTKNTFRKFVNDTQLIPKSEEFRELLDVEIGLKPKKENDFFSFAARFLEQTKTRLNLKTGKKLNPHNYLRYRRHIDYVRNFNSRMGFDGFNNDFYNKFHHYLAHDLQLATNSIGKCISDIKVILNRAAEEGLNSNLRFKTFKVLRETPDKIFLDEAELQAMYELDLSDRPAYDRVRDMFLIGCYTSLRYSDFTKLAPEHFTGDKIYIETEKQMKPAIIPLHSIVKEIMKKYNGEMPQAVSNMKMNKRIKQIAKLLPQLQVKIPVYGTKGGTRTLQMISKYKLVTTHTARRSFITNLLLKGFSPALLSKITGQDIKTIEKYNKATSDMAADIVLKEFWNKK